MCISFRNVFSLTLDFIVVYSIRAKNKSRGTLYDAVKNNVIANIQKSRNTGKIEKKN